MTLSDLLHSQGCSLVVKDVAGNVATFNQKGVRDLMHIIENSLEMLASAEVADKVIGKAAAGLMAYGGVSSAYGDVVSVKALKLFEKYGIACSAGKIVDHIVIPEGDTRCHLEEIVDSAETADDVLLMLRRHFSEIRH